MMVVVGGAGKGGACYLSRDWGCSAQRNRCFREKRQPVCNVRVVKCVDEGFHAHTCKKKKKKTQGSHRIQLAVGSLRALALLSLASSLSPPALLSILLTTSCILLPAVLNGDL